MATSEQESWSSWTQLSFEKRSVTALRQGFLISKFADLVVTWSFPLANKRHSKMIACLHCGKTLMTSATSAFFLHYLFADSPHGYNETSMNRACLMPRASVPFHFVENKPRYIRVTGSLTARVALQHYLLHLTQIWENISHVYGTTAALPHSTIPRYLLLFTLPISTATALHSSPNFTQCGPFQFHIHYQNTTPPPPIRALLLLTTTIFPYYNQ